MKKIIRLLTVMLLLLSVLAGCNKPNGEEEKGTVATDGSTSIIK